MSWRCEGFQPGTPLRQPAPTTAFVPFSLHRSPRGPAALPADRPSGRGPPTPPPSPTPPRSPPGPQPRQFVAMLVAGPPRRWAWGNPPVGRVPPGPRPHHGPLKGDPGCPRAPQAPLAPLSLSPSSWPGPKMPCRPC